MRSDEPRQERVTIFLVDCRIGQIQGQRMVDRWLSFTRRV